MATDPKRPRTTPKKRLVRGTEFLGKGTFGEVYSGKYGTLPVAVKIVPRAHLRESEEDSKREEEAMMKLNHPNVLKLFDVKDKKESR
jgi:serine/threonine protein kinase